MTTPVRAPTPNTTAVPGRPLPPVGQAARFSELLKQRRPPELPEPPVPDDIAELPDGVAPSQAATADTACDDEPALPPEAEVPPVEVAVATVAAVPWTDDRCGAAMREVALTIAGFCNDRAVNDGALWQVQMALRADVVPDTTLHLSLSPHWLTLRFHAGEPAALDLLSRGAEALRQVLDTTLARKRDIAITFESP
ncbi:type III secretion system protein SctP [Piscinibacter gummiphilus]|uniref:Uncharacterized protein n=1 Tax=Piscinibacter gummiphilus TaxID=946333 RepID=A0A1W6L9D9_9BURK|nr:type III secretion system protein SctP [Piscinibacter gummiphilus]ARN20787.1 hypothetical protein A4W93_13265 [Piscinibacter gummiphilus]ATU65463.1 hypothetical protein CPZ87_13345 [Piscinibacter gummiphilus]GLS94619.1 hypothetical protein GCM10007918_19110 [Piscinibacter gummiphilus]